MLKLVDAPTLGLSPSVLNALRAEMAVTPQLQSACIFGSRAKGNYRHGSDIDIALFGPDLTSEQLLALENRLDDLLLPYQIDLCHVDTLQNLTLIEHIQRIGQPIYQRA